MSLYKCSLRDLNASVGFPVPRQVVVLVVPPSPPAVGSTAAGYLTMDALPHLCRDKKYISSVAP